MKIKLLIICFFSISVLTSCSQSTESTSNSKKNGLFFETITSDSIGNEYGIPGSSGNYYVLGEYKDNIKVGLWIECSKSNLYQGMLTIGFYDDKGNKKGIWWGWDSCNKKVVEEFFNLKKMSCALADDIKYWNLFKLVVDGNFDIHFLDFFQNGNLVEINPTLNGKPIDGQEWEGYFRLGVEDMCKELINTEYIRPWKKDNALYKDWLMSTQ